MVSIPERLPSAEQGARIPVEPTCGPLALALWLQAAPGGQQPSVAESGWGAPRKRTQQTQELLLACPSKGRGWPRGPAGGAGGRGGGLGFMSPSWTR